MIRGEVDEQQKAGDASTVSVLLYGSYACVIVGLSSALHVGQTLANGKEIRPIPTFVVFSSISSIRIARAIVNPPARGVVMSWRACTVFISAAMTMMATYLPSLQERVFELMCSFMADVVAKWLMMIVTVKSEKTDRDDKQSSWKVAKRLYDSASADLCIDWGGDSYIASLFVGNGTLTATLYALYIFRMLRNVFLIFAACKEIGKFDNERAIELKS